MAWAPQLGDLGGGCYVSADRLVASLPDEKDTVRAVLAKLEYRCRKLNIKLDNDSQDTTSEMTSNSVLESKSPTDYVESTSNDESEKKAVETTFHAGTEMPKFSEQSKDITNSANVPAVSLLPF